MRWDGLGPCARALGFCFTSCGACVEAGVAGVLCSWCGQTRSTCFWGEAAQLAHDACPYRKGGGCRRTRGRALCVVQCIKGLRPGASASLGSGLVDEEPGARSLTGGGQLSWGSGAERPKKKTPVVPRDSPSPSTPTVFPPLGSLSPRARPPGSHRPLPSPAVRPYRPPSLPASVGRPSLNAVTGTATVLGGAYPCRKLPRSGARSCRSGL